MHGADSAGQYARNPNFGQPSMFELRSQDDEHDVKPREYRNASDNDAADDSSCAVTDQSDIVDGYLANVICR